MSKIHFVDTSVLTELLNIPGFNKRHKQIIAEYLQLEGNGDIFVLPVAVLVETGNHIAHVSDGYEVSNCREACFLGEGRNGWKKQLERCP